MEYIVTIDDSNRQALEVIDLGNVI